MVINYVNFRITRNALMVLVFWWFFYDNFLVAYTGKILIKIMTSTVGSEITSLWQWVTKTLTHLVTDIVPIIKGPLQFLSWVSVLRIKVTHFRLLKIFKHMIEWKHVWWAELSVRHWLSVTQEVNYIGELQPLTVAWIFSKNLIMEYQEKPNVPRSSFSQPDNNITKWKKE